MCYGAQFIPVVTRAQFENKVHRSLENENSEIIQFCSVLLYIRNRTAVFYASQASSARPPKDITYYDYDEYGLICSYPCTKAMFKLTYWTKKRTRMKHILYMRICWFYYVMEYFIGPQFIT